MALFATQALPVQKEDGSFALFVPVALPLSLAIEGAAAGDIDGLKVSVKCSHDEQLWLTVTGYVTEEDARAGFEAVKSWLLWSSLARGHGFRFEPELRPITWFDEPPPDGVELGGVTGFADWGPVVYPTGKRVALISVGPLRAVSKPDAQRFFDDLSEAASLGVVAMEDLGQTQAGVDLFLASSWEVSNYARFLTLVNVLEALKSQPPASAGVQLLTERWLRDVADHEASGSLTADEARSLSSSLNHLKHRSIRSSVRALVADFLNDEGEARQAAEIYDERSSLVHDGIQPSDIAARVLTLNGMVRRLLQSLLVAPSPRDSA